MSDRRIPVSGGAGALLDRLDALPSPSPVAMRLLAALDDATAISTSEVVELVSSDPALAGRVIATCARHPRYRSYRIDSIERAVVLLGFEAVRVTALSVRFLESMSGFTDEMPEDAFDIGLFWRHSLSVAVLAERIAERGCRVPPSTAFVAGLLHDIGHLGLCAVAPRVFRSACEMAEMECSSVDAIATDHRIDGRAAGRRIGDHWVPAEIVDSIWLVDQPRRSSRCASPNAMITSLADAVVSGSHLPAETRSAGIGDRCAAELRIDVRSIGDLRSSVLEVDARAEAGPGTPPDHGGPAAFGLPCNAVLGRFAARDQVSRVDRCQSDIDALVAFHESGPSVQSTTSSTVSGFPSFGTEAATACVILSSADESSEPVIRLRSLGRSRTVEFSAGMPSDVARDVLSRHCLERVGRPVHLRLSDGGAAVIALGSATGSKIGSFEPSAPLKAAWTTAIDDVLARERAVRLSERLAEANREIMIHRETLAQARASAAIGAIAAGAAHEINNPLAIITGRSHLLGRCLAETELSVPRTRSRRPPPRWPRWWTLSESVAP